MEHSTWRLALPLYAPVAIIFFLALCFAGLVFRKRLTPHQLPLPPGPEGHSFFGNNTKIDRREPWLTFGEWKASYGEIFSCKLLGQTCVVVNSERVARVLEQHSSTYTSCPVLRTCSLFGMDTNARCPPCYDAWSSHQRTFYQHLNNSTACKYHDLVTKTARVLLVNLLRFPQHFENHFRTYAASVVLSATYDYDMLLKDDPLEAAIEEVIRIIDFVTPEKAALLHRFPQLVKLPSWFAGIELWRWTKRCRESIPKIQDTPFEFVQQCLLKDIKNDSMVAQFLKDKNVVAQDDQSHVQDMKDCATSSVIAGISITQSALSAIVLALILYPEAQTHAQVEIDRVIGRNRLPTFNDRTSLPYVDALLREVLRWSLLVPITIPHVVTKDVIFEQRLIPKGSIMIQNLWGMARDEEIFSDPTAFRPERYLDADGNLFPDGMSGLYYGYGQIACPGRFRKTVGPAGYEIDVFPKFTGGLVRRPVPFSCSINPRFEGVMSLLN